MGQQQQVFLNPFGLAAACEVEEKHNNVFLAGDVWKRRLLNQQGQRLSHSTDWKSRVMANAAPNSVACYGKRTARKDNNGEDYYH